MVVDEGVVGRRFRRFTFMFMKVGLGAGKTDVVEELYKEEEECKEVVGALEGDGKTFVAGVANTDSEIGTDGPSLTLTLLSSC